MPKSFSQSSSKISFFSMEDTPICAFILYLENSILMIVGRTHMGTIYYFWFLNWINLLIIILWLSKQWTDFWFLIYNKNRFYEVATLFDIQPICLDGKSWGMIVNKMLFLTIFGWFKVISINNWLVYRPESLIRNSFYAFGARLKPVWESAYLNRKERFTKRIIHRWADCTAFV